MSGGNDEALLAKKLGEDGLPEMTPERREENFAKGKMMLVLFSTVPRIVCYTIASLIYNFGSRLWYDKQIGRVGDMQLGYLYVGVFVFSLLVSFLNMWPTAIKGKVMFAKSGNLRANMMIYKVNQPAGEKPLPYVVLEEDGPIGEYNRANRSLFHFNENSANVILNIIFAGVIFPFPMMVLIIIFALGRILHQLGYASGGYGKHAPGFFLAMISSVIMEGLVLLAAAKSLGAW